MKKLLRMNMKEVGWSLRSNALTLKIETFIESVSLFAKPWFK
jgi:hypothetical protein